MATGPVGHFVYTGTGILPASLAASSSSANALGSTGTVAAGSQRYDLGRPYSAWGLRVRLVGAGTSGQIQLVGSIATSSDANGALRPLTTWDGAVNSSDDVVFITGKPVTSVMAVWSTPSSSATSALVSIAGTP